MKAKILILGAGFGGLELSTLLSEALGDSADVTLIDKSDHFMFGFSKLDVLFGHAELRAVRLPYRRFVKPGVRFLRETVQAIDPTARRVTTDKGVYDADHLVVALGAEYDFEATPGLSDVVKPPDDGFTRSPARKSSAPRFLVSNAVTLSSASAARRSSVLRRPANAFSCCTTIWSVAE